MIIVTGFAPFHQETSNPSWEVAKKLPNRIEGTKIHKLQLPVSYQKAFAPLEKTIQNALEEVQGVLCLGQAKGRAAITPEGIAINRKFANIPDEDGQAPLHLPIHPSGPDAYFTDGPIFQMVEEMKAEGIPAAISYHAGTYVCNSVYYMLLHFREKVKKNFPCVFVHVPYSAGQ
ncbi:MAG: pyroglutamyl-peptidase I, partial [Clostridiales bacterium]|nr:pyroglutamyl-peptidase I [Clostridiales bacterium]